MQMRHKISWVAGPKFTKFVTVVIIFCTNGVNATIRVAIRPLVAEWATLKKSNIGKISPAG